jgi:hypothetical protein
MKKLSISIALLLLLTGCGSSESADGTRDAGVCTTIGEIIETDGEMAICLNNAGNTKYYIEGPVIEDIKLLAGIDSFEFYLSEEGQALSDDLGWSFQDFNDINYDPLNLKRYIADKPKWKDVAALIIAEEKTRDDVDLVERNYCPPEPDAFCAPKVMSAKGQAEWFRTSELWDAATKNLTEQLELIAVDLEGQYQVDGFKAAAFAIESLRNAGN